MAEYLLCTKRHWENNNEEAIISSQRSLELSTQERQANSELK